MIACVDARVDGKESIEDRKPKGLDECVGMVGFRVLSRVDS